MEGDALNMLRLVFASPLAWLLQCGIENYNPCTAEYWKRLSIN